MLSDNPAVDSFPGYQNPRSEDQYGCPEDHIWSSFLSRWVRQHVFSFFGKRYFFAKTFNLKNNKAILV